MRCMRKTLPKIERNLEDRRRTRRVPRGTSILRAAALFVLMLACLPAFGCRRETPQHIVLDLLPETAEPAVRQPTPTPAPPFYLNVTESTIYGGGVCQLVAYENPGAMECRTVRWRSENEDVAIVIEIEMMVDGVVAIVMMTTMITMTVAIDVVVIADVEMTIVVTHAFVIEEVVAKNVK